VSAAKASALLASDVERQAERLGRRVRVDRAQVLDRGAELNLQRLGVFSANGSCRLVRARDGWIALNLARDADTELLPAWMERRSPAEPWQAIRRWARSRPTQVLVERGVLLGLPVARVGEVKAGAAAAPVCTLGKPGEAGRAVIYLSGLWAGPLCGALLADAGLAVTKIESADRPDTTRIAMPVFDARLNGAKRRETCDFADPAQRRALRRRILDAGVVITSARRRAFAQLGLDPASMFAERPGLVWVAISGYGWLGDGVNRVAFGDDAAAAGGLVRWTDGGKPRFIGDALADPLTGMAAAAAAFGAIAHGGGVLIDAAMAGVAAYAAKA